MGGIGLLLKAPLRVQVPCDWWSGGPFYQRNRFNILPVPLNVRGEALGEPPLPWTLLHGYSRRCRRLRPLRLGLTMMGIHHACPSEAPGHLVGALGENG